MPKMLPMHSHRMLRAMLNKRCAKQQLAPWREKQERTIKIFTCLMLKGQTRSAVRWLTERAQRGGVSPMLQLVNAWGTTVIDVVKENHSQPMQGSQGESISVLHVMNYLYMCVDIMGAHTEKAVRQIQGGGGPVGMITQHWQDCLLHYRAQSEHLSNWQHHHWMGWQVQRIRSTEWVTLQHWPTKR